MSVTIYENVEKVSFALDGENRPHRSDSGNYQAHIHFEGGKIIITTWLTPEFAKLIPAFNEINHTP